MSLTLAQNKLLLACSIICLFSGQNCCHVDQSPSPSVHTSPTWAREDELKTRVCMRTTPNMSLPRSSVIKTDNANASLIRELGRLGVPNVFSFESNLPRISETAPQR